MEEKDNRLSQWKRLSGGSFLIALGLLLGFGIYQYKQKLNYRQYLQNRFQESFYEATTYVDNMENLFTKVRLTKSPDQSAPLFAQIWREASSAQDNLAELPYDHNTISKALKFLSQASDFSFSMTNKAIEGFELDEEDWKKVDQLKKYAKILSDELNKIKQEVNDGKRIDWEEIESEGEKRLAKGNTKAITGSFSEISKQFEDIPTLIYDGPFSDHIERMEPRMTRNKKKISKEEGKKVVEEFIGKDKVKSIKQTGETDTKVEHTIPVYSYQVVLRDQDEPTISIDVTQHGGLVLWMLNYTEKESTEEKLSLEEARKKAEKFLEERNYPNMKASYYEKVDGTVVINFAPYENKVIMYPDLIKVKVAMDDGEIIGFESLGYIMMHHDRKLPEIKITEEEARDKITKDFKVQQVNMAVIPLESKREVLCYEFKGEFDNQLFLIYINAESGKQEKILQILQSKNAVLTK
ncbi:MAG: germination protein YpeB [Epulopiscium sp.]|jgi:spore germination protein|nr:germination protein YpeB [Candidatus Epulonipiscium sp.]HOQ17283.1 germination protein YpeB [Defluviitaleaceae bacterium]HPT75670.1 germination protein YpeB [Defluviitaleaceae bacterium]